MSAAVRPVKGTSFKIAIVEDHDDIRDWMRICLQEEFCVSTHSTARDLLAFLSANPCDLILSDIWLPEMDGFVLLANIRSNPTWHDLPVIAVTAHIAEADREKALQAGFDACLTKPVDLDEMLQIIRTYLPQRRFSYP